MFLHAHTGVDLHHPSTARVYDFMLGGSAHWSVDRSFGRRVLAEFPEFRDIVRANRLFRARVVRRLVQAGVRQFLDLGSGVLTSANTHQIAESVAPDTRVVYAEQEPVAVAHAELLLDEVGDPDRHAVVNADVCDPAGLWQEALATHVLDPAEPVAVLLFSVLHTLRPAPHDPAVRVTAGYRALIPPGSYLAVSHVTDEGVPRELAPKLAAYKKLSDDMCEAKTYCRSHKAISALLGEFELVRPGMTWVAGWHPEADRTGLPAANHSVVWAGVGRKSA